MTRGGLREFLDTIRPRYLRAGRRDKSRILDETQKVTGLHRKALIRSLRNQTARVSPGRVGRPRRYGPAAAAAKKRLSIAPSSRSSFG